GQRHLTSLHCGPIRPQGEPATRTAEMPYGRLLMHADAQTRTRVAQAPREPGRVNQGAAVPVPYAAQVRGRAALGRYRPGPKQLATALRERGQLPWSGGDTQLTRPLEVTLDAVLGDGGLDLVEVLPAQPLEFVDLVREAGAPVGPAVGQAGRAEA